MQRSLSFYRWFSGLPWPKSYLGKFLLVAFLGVHLPLIALVGYVALRQSATWSEALPVLSVALIATLVGTGATLFIQSGLLAPLLQTARALETYRRTRQLPQLPTNFSDDAGVLMASAQNCVNQLEDLLAMKRDLLTVISHDTRNPMSQIVTASQLTEMALTREPVNTKRLGELNTIIRKASDAQIKLMDGLMMLMRSERAAVEVSRDEVVVSDLLTAAVQNVELQAERKSVRVQTEEGNLPPDAKLVLDAAKTGQVLNNLLHNAVKFTPEGGQVTLRAEIQAQNGASMGRWLVLSVRDSGIGMDEAIQAGLFVPFNKAGRAGTAGEASSGVGLWICKLFTEAQGGQIEVNSQVGQGTNFVVRLPWQEVPAAPKASSTNAGAAAPSTLFAETGVLASAR